MAESPEATPVRGARLVDETVNQSKFNEQLRRWDLNAEVFKRRGWLLLSKGDLTVEVGFLREVPIGGRVVPMMTACVRIDYWNFDLWPPSVTFLNPITREPAPPPVRAPDRMGEEEPRDNLIDGHPGTGQPFLCLPGIREYHIHPQHNGDDWLLHRHLGEGDLVVVCERIWRRMSRNVLGVSLAVQSHPFGTQVEVNILQGDADLVQRQLDAQNRPAEAAPPVMAQPPPGNAAAAPGASQPESEPVTNEMVETKHAAPNDFAHVNPQQEAL